MVDALATLLTATGYTVTPFDLKPEMVHLKDIAYGLSNFCRYGGQLTQHYSVAQHSIAVGLYLAGQSEELTRELGSLERAFGIRLKGLLHDASEAYLGDLPSPFKKMPQYAFYREAEERAMRAIYQSFNLVWPAMDEEAAIHEADQAIFRAEDTKLRGSTAWEVDPLAMACLNSVLYFNQVQTFDLFLLTFNAFDFHRK